MNSEKTRKENTLPFTDKSIAAITQDADTKLTSRKFYSALLGGHVIVWLFQGAGVVWWWKGLPYLASVLLIVCGVVMFGRRMWHLDKVQRVILLGFVVVFSITASACLIPGGITLATPVQEIFVRRSFWNSFDQLVTITILAALFLISISIARYVPNGRVWLGFGIVSAILLYGVLRLSSENLLTKEFWGAGDHIGFSNKNAFGHLLNLGFVFSLVIALTKSRENIDWKEKIIFGSFCVLLGVCIAVNNSRGGLLSLAAAVAAVIFFLLFKKRKKKKKHNQTLAAIAAIILAFGCAIIAPEFLKRFDTNELSDYRFRYVVWAETIRQLPDVWLAGVGLQGFRYRYNSSPVTLPESLVTHAESSFLTTAYEQGLPTTLLLASFLILHVGMSVSQKNRSWRAATIGVGILTLIISHGIYETLNRFAALNIAAALFLGMLHGQRAWKSGLSKLKSVPMIKPALAVFLGVSFSWGIYILSVHLKYLAAYEATTSAETDKSAWEATRNFLSASWDEFERTSQLTHAWRIRSSKTGIQNDEQAQKILDLSFEQLTRQPADPLAWLSAGFAHALSRTLTDKFDPSGNLQTAIQRLGNFSDTIERTNLSRKLFRQGEIEFTDVVEKIQPPELPALAPNSLLEASSTRGIFLPAQTPEADIWLPFLSDDEVKKSILQYTFLRSFVKRLVSKQPLRPEAFFEPRDEQLTFITIWIAQHLPPTNEIEQTVSSDKTQSQTARSFANSNAIYPSLMSFYRDAMATLAIHSPESLPEYYSRLTPRQQETLWAAWQRFLVYEPAMRSQNLLEWIVSSSANSQIRLQAARMMAERNPQELLLTLKQILSDKEAPLQIRLDALDSMQTLAGYEIWTADIPADMENSFEVQARRLIAAYNAGIQEAAKYAAELTKPSFTTPPRLVVQTGEILEKMGNTTKAVEIYRAATENTNPAQAARQRTLEVRRRIAEAGIEPQIFLGRLAFLSRTEDAQPGEILDYLNLSLTLDLHLGARDFLQTKTPRGLNAEQERELTYYTIQIAALDKQIETEIRLHKQILSKQ